MAIEIENMLVVSTGHLSAETVFALPRDRGDNCELSWGPAFWRDEGWLFNVALGAPEAPVDLRAVLAFAHEKGCTWVMLDRDGPVIDELPYYDW